MVQLFLKYHIIRQRNGIYFPDARKECEDLRSQGSDKHAETRLENLKHDLEKQIHDLQHKNKVV